MGDFLSTFQPGLALPQRILGPLALGDILNLGNEVEGSALRIAHQRDAQYHPHHVPMAVEVPLLHLIGVYLAGDESIMRKVSAEIEASLDRQTGIAFDRLCEQLTEDNLFGEIL